jgi:diguanylate cyclase (GGDEF)-like protein/PAS domain S-box-containing protein
MLKTFPKVQNGIFILDREGRFLADYPSHPELRGQSFAFREYYRRTIQEGRGIVGAPYKSRRTGLPVLTFTAPVRDAKGRIVAVLACSADLLARESLGGYWKQKFGTTGYLYVFDRSRLLILHPDNNRLLTQVEAGKNRILEAALSGFEGGGETVNSMGVPMLLSVRQIPKAGWIVAVQVTREEAYAPVAQSRERIMLISGIALLPAILLGAVAIRRITRPLQQLERVASQISVALEEAETKETYDPAQSALDDLTTIRSRDEIGLLASSFFRLATKLNLTLGSLQRSARDWERTFNSVNEAVVTLDMESRIMRMNHAAEAMFRTSRQKIQGHYAYQVLFDVALPPLDWPDFARLSEHQRVRWSQHLEKPPRIMEFTITPVTVAGNVVGAVLVISDITERVESEDHIREMAFYDQLTGLPNRFLLQDRIRQAIASAERSGKKAGIMFLDLDHFKIINDLCGHDVGDEVLKQEAGRISKCLRKNDTLSRIGGDEFVIVLQEIDNLREAATIAERIIGEQASPCSIQGHALTISSSIGIAIFPEDGVDGETLLKNADQAMYRAKGRGRGTYQFVQHKTGNSDESATRE